GPLLWQREHNLLLSEAAAHQEAIRQLKRADRRFHDARDIASDMLARVGGVEFKNAPRLETLRAKMLADSLRYYDRFLIEESNDPTVREDAGWAYLAVGRIRDMLGKRPAAIAAYYKAADIYGRLVEEDKNKDPTDPSVQGHRADLSDAYRLL